MKDKYVVITPIKVLGTEDSLDKAKELAGVSGLEGYWDESQGVWEFRSDGYVVAKITMTDGLARRRSRLSVISERMRDEDVDWMIYLDNGLFVFVNELHFEIEGRQIKDDQLADVLEQGFNQVMEQRRSK